MLAAESPDRLARSARSAARTIFDLLLPPSCPGCDTPVGKPGLICGDCFQMLTLLTEPLCRRCGVPFPFEAAGGRSRLCPGCREHPPVFERARAALMYDAGAARLILPLKYGDRIELADVLALHMSRAGSHLLQSAEVLVPVPLHRRRLFTRRYNQAALLARALGRRSGIPVVPDALVRNRATTSLGELTAAERAAEVSGAFALRGTRAPRIHNRRVLLIDDVLTSGATANACSEILKHGGAAAVDVLAAARAPDPRLA